MKNSPNAVSDSRSRDDAATFRDGLQGGASPQSSEGHGRSSIGDTIESGRGAATGQYGTDGQYPSTRSDAMHSAFYPDDESLRHFQKLRDEQLRGFDEDFSAWTKERNGTWVSEFENWRSSRNSAYGADPDRTET